MTAKCKIIWIMAVPYSFRGKASWSGTDPPLVAVLFLHQRRGWCPLGEANEDDKIPICYLNLLFGLFESSLCHVSAYLDQGLQETWSWMLLP